MADKQALPDQATKPGSWRIWKLLSGIVVTVLLFVGLPLILERFGFMPALNAKAGWVLFVTACGLIIKIILGDMISGGFNYQRHGYDLCIITLGASISNLSLQITTKYDLFPGLPNYRVITAIESISADSVQQRLILLVGILLLSCILSLVTAYIGKAIRDENARGRNSLSILSFAFGAFVFGANILLLITKG